MSGIKKKKEKSVKTMLAFIPFSSSSPQISKECLNKFYFFAVDDRFKSSGADHSGVTQSLYEDIWW